MHRFWDSHVDKVIRAAAPRRIMEVGAEFGWNTEPLLQYCRETGCRLDVVDPMPHPVLHEVLARFPDEHQYHPLPSLKAIPLLPPADLVLLDGDHNWYTVYTELQLLFARAVQTNTAAPVVLFHDVAWPYARRDMYYDPMEIPDAMRHEWAYRGIIQGQSELADGGLNGNFRNAMHEGGLRNGVLTGIEDFIGSWSDPVELRCLPFFNGLGILIPQARKTNFLQEVIDGFFSGPSLLEVCERLERDAMAARTELAATRLELTRKSEALVRARARILELNALKK